MNKQSLNLHTSVHCYAILSNRMSWVFPHPSQPTSSGLTIFQVLNQASPPNKVSLIVCHGNDSISFSCIPVSMIQYGGLLLFSLIFLFFLAGGCFWMLKQPFNCCDVEHKKYFPYPLGEKMEKKKETKKKKTKQIEYISNYTTYQKCLLKNPGTFFFNSLICLYFF